VNIPLGDLLEAVIFGDAHSAPSLIAAGIQHDRRRFTPVLSMSLDQRRPTARTNRRVNPWTRCRFVGAPMTRLLRRNAQRRTRRRPSSCATGRASPAAPKAGVTARMFVIGYASGVRLGIAHISNTSTPPATCDATVYGPERGPPCRALNGPAAVRISNR
jgi:hypothetical protein